MLRKFFGRMYLITQFCPIESSDRGNLSLKFFLPYKLALHLLFFYFFTEFFLLFCRFLIFRIIMVVKHINSDNEFEQSMAEAGENKLIICDFFAEW